MIIPAAMVEPLYPVNPTLQLNAPAGAVSLCVSVVITISNVLGDGHRPLNNLRWSLTGVQPKNSTVQLALSSLCQATTLAAT